MTALEEPGYGQPARHPLAPGATPTAIRKHLLRGDRTRFDRALVAAHVDDDQDAVDTCLEHWRRIAVVQRDPQNFERVVRRAAERRTGEASPPDEPLAVTRAKARM